MKKIGYTILFFFSIATLCVAMKWVEDHNEIIKGQREIIHEKDIDVRALFYSESQTGKDAVIDLRGRQ